MAEIKKYIEDNKKRFLNELFGLLKIQSISSLPEKKKDMHEAAEYWKKLLLTAGADKTDIYTTNGNPVVFAEKNIGKSAPTILVYGHYDVMPVDPLDLWKSPPFEPEIKDGKIYARGADDDKGQSFIHAKAFEYLIANNLLRCNVKFMLEGEEEIGSPNLVTFCAKHKDLLKSDIILVSDTNMLDAEVPSITTGLRGLAYLQIELTGPNRDLHSGLYGGAVANPINILTKMLASLTDSNNRITIPGFYDDVKEISASERAELNKAPFNIESYKKSIGINEIWGETGYTTIERTGIRPSFDINGIWGGYMGEGSKTVIPSTAFAKISFRLVPNQNHSKIAQLVEDHLKKIAPPSVSLVVKNLHGGPAYVSPIDTPEFIAASKAVEKVFGKKPIPVRTGGSIPIIANFEQVLGVKSILLGFGLESDAIHSPNENFPLENLFKGIETVIHFYEFYADSVKE